MVRLKKFSADNTSKSVSIARPTLTPVTVDLTCSIATSATPTHTNIAIKISKCYMTGPVNPATKPVTQTNLGNEDKECGMNINIDTGETN